MPQEIPFADIEKRLIGVFEDAPERAGDVLLRHFRAPLDVRRKSDKTPVTQADTQSENEIRAVLASVFPDHPVYGEETQGDLRASGWQWIIDPLDGTKSFVVGFPVFASMIALLWNNRAVASVVDFPALGERWVALPDHVTWNGRPVGGEPKGVTSVEEAVMFVGNPEHFRAHELAAVEKLAAPCRFSRYGADAMAYCLVASGYGDVVVDAAMQCYDIMPLVPIVEGSGGVMTDWYGAPLHPQSDGRVLATSNRELHRACLEQLKNT